MVRSPCCRAERPGHRSIITMNQDASPSPLTNEAIAMRARKLWASAGSPAGRDLEFWLNAETELRNERAEKPASPRDSHLLPNRPPPRRAR
jgi:hypothetical protein